MRRFAGGKTMLSAKECTNRAAHTLQPEGYLAWHDWAEKMTKTHKQVRCPVCTLYEIWIRREPREGRNG